MFHHVRKNLFEFASLTSMVPADVQDGECLPCMSQPGAEAQGEEMSLVAAAAVAEEAPAPSSGLSVEKWEGPICVEETLTGDGRMMRVGSLFWEALPIPLRYVESDTGGHDNATVVGTIETIERRDDGIIWATGTVSPETPEGPTAIGKLQRMEQNGVSVDLDSVSFEVHVAQDLVSPETEEASSEEASVEAKVVDAQGRVKVMEMNSDDEVMLVTRARIRAATIVAIPAFAEARISLVSEETTPTLTASAFRKPPEASWFADPGLTQVTPLTVTSDGRVFGHLAAWGTCHIAYAECTQPPSSLTNYRYFHLSAIETADGSVVPVGKLTVDARHAADAADARDTTIHYDHTGATAAFVRAGEDAHGIWVAGVVNPDASSAQVRALSTSPLSGDWRNVGGNLELVAALSVNVPGFPIPRPSGLVASGNQLHSLVAAGMVPPAKVKRPGSEGSLSAEDLKYLKVLAEREKKSQQAARSEELLEQARALAATLGSKEVD